jgi:hypothetical protein
MIKNLIIKFILNISNLYKNFNLKIKNTYRKILKIMYKENK